MFRVCIFTTLLTIAFTADWNHDPNSDKGPSAWSHDDCKGKGQSPIDITHDDAEYDTSLGALTFKNYDSTHVNTSFRLHNNGHTVQVDVMQNGMSNGTRYQTRFKGEDYSVLQFHFHWGMRDFEGSEHAINGFKYPAELHIVHWNMKYDFNEKLNKKDGLLVLGMFIKVGDKEHAGMAKLTDFFGKTNYKKMDHDIATFPLNDILTENMATEFYNYDGSLTTPPCSEAVHWIVAKNPIYMSRMQLAQFRSLHSNEAHETDNSFISGNFRPLMTLHGRPLRRSFQGDAYDNNAHALNNIPSIMVPLLLLVICYIRM